MSEFLLGAFWGIMIVIVVYGLPMLLAYLFNRD